MLSHEDEQAVGGWKERAPTGPQRQERARGSCRAPDLLGSGRFVPTVPPKSLQGSLCREGFAPALTSPVCTGAGEASCALCPFVILP